MVVLYRSHLATPPDQAASAGSRSVSGAGPLQKFRYLQFRVGYSEIMSAVI